MSDLSNMSVDELLDAAYEPEGYRAVGELALRAREGEALAARLPKTADGVPVVPGDKVYHPQSICHDHSCTVIAGDLAGSGPDTWYANVPTATGRDGFVCRSEDVDISECYSTREAALAAREGEGVEA